MQYRIEHNLKQRFVLATNDLDVVFKVEKWQEKFGDKLCRFPITLTKIEKCLGLNNDLSEPKLSDNQLVKSILVVDDNPINILLATKLIQQYYPNTKVKSAKSGAEAIEIYAIEDFELILMDIHMPDMNGYQTTAELRKLKPKAKTQIVALTASDTLEEREECIKNNMDGYLTKPIKEKDFLAIVSAK